MGQGTKQQTETVTHHTGTRQGEELSSSTGNEPGRHEKGKSGAGRPAGVRTARDSTGINPDMEEPILPNMPHMPPA